MSETESDQDEKCSEDVTHEITFIAEKVRAHPEILEKSQIPSMKTKKTTSVNKIVQEYIKLFGKKMDIKVFMKKVNNMKTRLKNKTGNKRIRLLPWEKIMLEAMNADINPVLSQIQGALAIGVSTLQPSPHTSTDASMTERNVHQMNASGMADNRKRSSESLVQEVVPKQIPTKPKLSRNITVADAGPEESDETRYLTTTQLQRLVLIEQLKTARIQQEYFSAKLKKLAETSNKELSNMYTVMEDKTYFNM